MRYLVVGGLSLASIVVGGVSALNWALHGTMALAWIATAFAVLGVVVLIGCLGLYAFRDEDDAGPQRPGPAFGPVSRTAFGPVSGTTFGPVAGPGPVARPRDRAQERAWLEPQTRVPPAGRGASTPRPRRALDAPRTAPRT